MEPVWPTANTYLSARGAARTKAQAEFVFRHPEALPLVALSNEYIAATMQLLSGRNMARLKHGLYVGDLIVSFTRTHFIAQDLLGFGELIEAAVLIRKQMELLARLHELAENDSLDSLIRRTPNVRPLGKQIRCLYSVYSEIAHSSNPIHLQQLGRVEIDGVEYTPIYPVYDSNSIVTFQHQVLTVVEFHNWAHPFLSAAYEDFDADAADELIGDLARHFVDAYVPQSERGD